jgi:hypothetical protein
MQSVYEKTLALLYRGSKNAANNNAAIKVHKFFVYSGNISSLMFLRRTIVFRIRIGFNANLDLEFEVNADLNPDQGFDH